MLAMVGCMYWLIYWLLFFCWMSGCVDFAAAISQNLCACFSSKHTVDWPKGCIFVLTYFLFSGIDLYHCVTNSCHPMDLTTIG